MNEPTFIRLWNEYKPKWVSVKEFQNLNTIIALSKEYDIICSDGEITMMGYLWERNGEIGCDGGETVITNVTHIFVVPPLLTEK